MKLINKKWLILMIGALVLLSCNFPVSAIQLNPAAQQTSATAVVSPTPDLPDYALARLTEADLPAGFRELTAEELASLGLSPSTFTNAFTGMLSKAEPQNFAAFTNTSSSFEVIASILLVPLTPLERSALDLLLRDPQRLIREFSGQPGLSDLSLDESAGPVGDSSTSAIFAVRDAPLKMIGGITISRRGEVLQIALLFYPDGSQPSLTSYAVAEIVDAKLANLK